MTNPQMSRSGNAESLTREWSEMDDRSVQYGDQKRKYTTYHYWGHSWMVSIYKGKGDALECNSYRGIKLLEHAMKVFERVIKARLREGGY